MISTIGFCLCDWETHDMLFVSLGTPGHRGSAAQFLGGHRRSFDMPLPLSSRRDATLPLRAFTLIELLVVVAIIALLVSILLPSLKNARISAKQVQNFMNLKQFGTSTQSYSSDFQDRIWAFSWRAANLGQQRNFRSQYADLNSPTDDIQAAHFQAVDIIRRRAQPQWGGANGSAFPTQGAWIPHVYYSHLVLMDYLAARLPEPMIHSPFDRVRAIWREDIIPNPQAAADRHIASIATPVRYRWLYSSSYETSVSSYSPHKFTTDGGSLRQFNGEFGVYTYNPGTQGRYRLGLRKLGDVAFPAAKAHMHESADRTQRNEVVFLHRAAKVALVAYDGNVRVVNATDMNQGGHLTASNTISREPITYPAAGTPVVGFPPSPSGQPFTEPARLRWTVGGIKGADFGVAEPFR